LKLITDKNVDVTIPEGGQVEIRHHHHTDNVTECLLVLRTYQRQGFSFTAYSDGGTHWWEASMHGVAVAIFLPHDITTNQAEALLQGDTPTTTATTTEEDR